MSAISVSHLQKTYLTKKGPPKEALKGVSLEVPEGSFFALLGPNGAGKSTLINILAGLVIKTAGEAKVMGFDIEKDMFQARTNLGVVPQELVLDTFFTVRQALDIHAGYYGVPKEKRRTQEIIDAMGLGDKADIHARRLSGGMRRRLLVAKALVHSPKVLILDEPTAGVDVELREQLWAYVRNLNTNGTTVLLTTHYLEEAEELCDQIAIINHGEVVANDKKTTLLQGFDSKECVITLSNPIADLPEKLKQAGAELTPDGMLLVHYKPSKTVIGDMIALIQAEGFHIRDITTEQARLEEVFKHLTSKKAA